jgi:hypothetical protein
MLISASALLLTTISAPSPSDITPVSLAVRPSIVDLGDAGYDWALQQRLSGWDLKSAANTANCNTQMTPTNLNGRRDSVPDCGFD